MYSFPVFYPRTRWVTRGGPSHISLPWSWATKWLVASTTTFKRWSTITCCWRDTVLVLETPLLTLLHITIFRRQSDLQRYRHYVHTRGAVLLCGFVSWYCTFVHVYFYKFLVYTCTWQFFVVVITSVIYKCLSPFLPSPLSLPLHSSHLSLPPSLSLSLSPSPFLPLSLPPSPLRMM